MPTKYVICDCHNFYESLDKEEIYAAIAEATGNTPTDCDSAFITKIKETNANGQLKFWVGTTAEFNAIATKADDTLYVLTDDDSASELDGIETALNGIIAGTTSVPNAVNATNATKTAFSNTDYTLAPAGTHPRLSDSGTYQIYITSGYNTFSDIIHIGGSLLVCGALISSAASDEVYRIRIYTNKTIYVEKLIFGGNWTDVTADMTIRYRRIG